MTRILKTSGFLGLTVMMCVGLYQATLLAQQNAVPAWMIGGHAHLGVLSILAVVMGFAVEAFSLTGRLRQAVSGMYVVGQWGVPLTVWGAAITGIGVLHVTTYLWGLALIVSMVVMAWQAATTETSGLGGAGTEGVAPSDD